MMALVVYEEARRFKGGVRALHRVIQLTQHSPGIAFRQQFGDLSGSFITLRMSRLSKSFKGDQPEEKGSGSITGWIPKSDRQTAHEFVIASFH
jgi:hypothetical protein